MFWSEVHFRVVANTRSRDSISSYKRQAMCPNVKENGRSFVIVTTKAKVDYSTMIFSNFTGSDGASCLKIFILLYNRPKAPQSPTTLRALVVFVPSPIYVPQIFTFSPYFPPGTSSTRPRNLLVSLFDSRQPHKSPLSEMRLYRRFVRRKPKAS